MSLRSRAGPADAETRAVFPAFGCPSGGLWYNSELEQPADTPHLLRCLRCAALNGRSAFRCWSCEAELPAGLPLGKPLIAGSDAGPDLAPQRSNHPAFFDALVGGADSPTTPGTAHAPAHADAPFSAPLSAVAIDERLAAFSQHRRRVPRRLVGVAAIVVFVAASGTGAYLIQRQPPFIALEADPAPRHAAAIVETPVDPEPVTARTADPSRIEQPPSEPLRTEAAAPVHIELLQPAAQAAAPPRAAPPPPVVAALTTTRGGSARGTRHARNTTAATLPVPIRGGSSDTVRPPTPAPPGACTATVAALGLCQAANAQPKE
jgi:hypothetical protein